MKLHIRQLVNSLLLCNPHKSAADGAAAAARPEFWRGLRFLLPRSCRAGSLHPANQYTGKEKPDQRGYQIEQKLRAHRGAWQARNGDGDGKEEVAGAAHNEDRCSSELFYAAVHSVS